MYRFVLALILIIFSFNAANASGLMTCCDMGKSAKTVTKVATPDMSTSMPKCHEMMGKADDKPSAPQKAKHCLCASLCASKMTNAADLPAFQAVAFEIPVTHGEHDRAASIDRKPESPPPKI